MILEIHRHHHDICTRLSHLLFCRVVLYEQTTGYTQKQINIVFRIQWAEKGFVTKETVDIRTKEGHNHMTNTQVENTYTITQYRVVQINVILLSSQHLQLEKKKCILHVKWLWITSSIRKPCHFRFTCISMVVLMIGLIPHFCQKWRVFDSTFLCGKVLNDLLRGTVVKVFYSGAKGPILGRASPKNCFHRCLLHYIQSLTCGAGAVDGKDFAVRN